MRLAVHLPILALLLASAACEVVAGDNDRGGIGLHPDGGPTIVGPASGVVARLRAEAAVHPEPGIPVSGCLSGGLNGLHVEFSDASAPDVRTRSLTVLVDQPLLARLELPTDPLQLGIDFEAVFGGPLSGQVSSADDHGSVSADVLPSYFGVWSRQAARVDRTADLLAVTAAGDEVEVGIATLYDWSFSVRLDQGAHCPPLLP